MKKYKSLHFLGNNCLKLLNTSKNTIILSIALFAILAITSNSMAATYYIDYQNGSDSNSGITKSEPWKRQPYMAGWSGSYSHSAGDIFVFKGGVTWAAACFQMTIAAGGTSEAQDEYTVDETWYDGGSYTAPVFDGENSLGSGEYLIRDDTGHGYVTFKGIKIIDVGISGVPEAYVFKVVLAEGQIYEDLEIIGYTKYGIVLNYGNTTITNGPKIRNCKISHFSTAIAVGNSGTVTNHVKNLEISGNEIFDPHTQLVNSVHGDGIHIWNTGDNRMFEDLLIFNNKFYGDWSGADADTSNTAMIFMEDCPYSAKIYNNHFTFSNTTTLNEDDLFEAIILGGASSKLEIFNNTICASRMATRPEEWENQWASFGPSAAIKIGGTGAFTIKGNIISDAKTAISVVSYGSFACDYNDIKIRPGGGRYGIDIGNYCYSLAQWQARGFGTNSTSDDPLFTDIVNTPLDLSLQVGSPAIDLFPTAQAPTGVLNSDINGTPRPQGLAWDAGAYEGADLYPRSPLNLKILTD